jgi:hypothetical protein
MSEFPKRVTVTGHRPKYYKTHNRSWAKVTDAMYEVALEYIIGNMPESRVYNIGMAVGWDLAVAQACDNCGVPYVAYMPCADQERLWPPHTQAIYRKLVNRASYIVVVSDEPYKPYLMLRRNARMMGECDHVMALYGGDPQSGTGHAIDIALENGYHIDNLHECLLQYFKDHPQG